MESQALLLPTVLSLMTAAAVAFLLTLLVRNVACDRGWMDLPDGRRKVQKTAVPHLSGVAVFEAFALTCAPLVALERIGAIAGLAGELL